MVLSKKSTSIFWHKDIDPNGNWYLNSRNVMFKTTERRKDSTMREYCKLNMVASPHCYSQFTEEWEKNAALFTNGTLANRVLTKISIAILKLCLLCLWDPEVSIKMLQWLEMVLIYQAKFLEQQKLEIHCRSSSEFLLLQKQASLQKQDLHLINIIIDVVFFSIKGLFTILCNLYIMWDFHVQLLKNMTFVSKKLKICCLGSR